MGRDWTAAALTGFWPDAGSNGAAKKTAAIVPGNRFVLLILNPPFDLLQVLHHLPAPVKRAISLPN